MPRLVPAFPSLCLAALALPLTGCGDGDADETTDPEAAQVSEEQEDVQEAKDDLVDAREELEDADEEIAERRADLRAAILEKEEKTDAVGDAERQLKKEKGDLAAEQSDPEPDLTNDPDLRRADGETGSDRSDPAAPAPPEKKPDVKIEADPGVDVEVRPDGD